MAKSKRSRGTYIGLVGLLLFIAALAFTFTRPEMKPPVTNMDEPVAVAGRRGPAASAPAAANDLSAVAAITRVGTFRGTGHAGSGNVTLTTANGKSTVHLEDSFYVTPGPDLYVGLGNNDRVDKNVLLGVLASNSGASAYEIPDGVDVSAYSQIIIYCKAYGYEFSVAPLN